MPAQIQFGTEQFTAAEGIPDHAAMIEGRLIHLDTKTLKGWGITAKASEQIIASIPGIPIRACNSHNPHACDLSYGDDSCVGYATKAWVDGEWIMAAAAITDKTAAKNVDNGTWTPFGKGGWSVVGFPDGSQDGFRQSGFMNGFKPTGIALVLASTATPAYVGSGFEMVAAAITNHRGDDMTETKNEGGTDPVTYTQDDLDAQIADAVKAATEKQKTEFAADANKHTTEELAKAKIEYDEAINKLSTDDKAAYDALIAETTPTADVEKMIAAAVTQGQADTLDAIEKDKLTTEYREMLTASVVLGAPYMTDGAIDPAKIEAKMVGVREMKVAAIAGIIDEAKMVAAAVPGTSAFNTMSIPSTPPGTEPEGVDQKALDAMGIPSIEFA